MRCVTNYTNKLIIILLGPYCIIIVSNFLTNNALLPRVTTLVGEDPGQQFDIRRFRELNASNVRKSLNTIKWKCNFVNKYLDMEFICKFGPNNKGNLWTMVETKCFFMFFSVFLFFVLFFNLFFLAEVDSSFRCKDCEKTSQNFMD